MTNLTSSSELTMFVTNAEADGPLLRVWGQLNKNDIGNMEKLINRLSRDFNKGIGCPVPESGSIWPNLNCCASFEGVFYRAKICSINHPAGIHVQFIDYGNKEIVNLSDIRIVDEFPEGKELLRVPPLAVDFVIADLLPINGAWDTRVLRKICIDIRYHNCPAKIVNKVGSLCFIRMFYGNQDFAQILINQNLAVPASLEDMIRAHSTSQQVHHQKPPIQIPKPLMQMPLQPPLRECPPKKYPVESPVAPRVPRSSPYQENWRAPIQPTAQTQKIQSPPQLNDAGVFRSRILEIGSQHEVKVSHVEDGPLMFSVQVNSTLEELKTLMYHINQTQPLPLAEPPVIGTVCLGRYTKDKSLLRAVVMQVREHDCKLHYVDFGHGEILPYTDIYQLPRQYINPRVFSIRFTMSEVNELRVDDIMKQYFKDYVDGKTLLLRVRPSEGSPLIQYGVLCDNGPSLKDILRAIYGDTTTTWLPPRKLNQSFREDVRVRYTDLPIIFLQADVDATCFESVLERLNEYAQSAPPLLHNHLTKGLHCLARSSIDSKWYRAEVINLSNDTATVFYVDYGKEETVNVKSLRSIPDNTFRMVPAQAIRCILNDYNKEVTTNELRKNLEAQLMAKSLAAVPRKIGPTGTYVDLFDSSGNQLVNIFEKIKRASVLNGNVDSRTGTYNDGNLYSTHSNTNRSDDQITKWNHNARSEAPRIPESSNPTERRKSNNWKNEENEPRRYNNRENRHQTREKEWSPNSGQQQNDRFLRTEGKNDRSPREQRYERNDRIERNDRSGDSNANIRGGRDNRDRGARGGFGNTRYPNNNSRTERNGSEEKTFSEKDSDTSSRSSGRSGRRESSGGRGGGGRGRRDGGRPLNNRENESDGERGFKNTRTNGVSSRIRENRKDFGERNENKQSEIWSSKTAPVSKQVNIPMPNITVGAVKNCELVFVKNPGDFHVQLSPDYYDLDPVMENIARIYENGGKILEVSTIKPGMDCVAQYSEDSRWYRANVQSIEANGATVRFVDYGNSETVDFSNIKELEPECAKLSAQAIACKLLAASKTSWDTEDIDKFSRLTSQKNLEAEFVANENNVFEVLMREVIDGKTSANYINEEFSGGADLTEAKNNARLKGRQRQGLSRLVPATDYAPIDAKWPVEEINPGTKQRVIIAWFTNPDSFYCQTLSRKNDFVAMMNEVQEVYANRQPINVPLQVGSPVMAVFSDDGALYRAEIIELNEARGNIVRYVDFGNKAIVEQRNIYRVEKKFMQIPKQAVNCSLKNIVPANGTNWAKSNIQEIEKCFDADNFGGSFEATFHDLKDQTYIISLNTDDVDVAGLLVEKSLAAFAVSAHVHVDENAVNAAEKPQIEELPRFDISLLAGQILRVKVSNVESAAKFHIQLPSADASANLIDEYMAKNDPKVMPRLSCREVCLGAGCLVNSDEGWRRAVVVNCSRTTGFDVRLIDTGANEEIPLDCMLALPGPLSVMQNQAVECCLINATANLVLDEKLRDQIENTTVIIGVEEVDNNRLIVKLYDTEGKSIKLNGEEETETIYPICPMPILYSTQKVHVSHAKHSSSVWLKRTQDLDSDSQLLARLFDHYSVPELNNEKPEIVPGAVCAAKSLDENWYRSKILRETETGALVQYIDYGDSEEVEMEFLRVLDPRFFLPPQSAIEVALTVALRGPVDQQEKILKSHILDEEFTATMYNVHKKWVAELTNAEGKISARLSALEEIDTTKNQRLQAAIPEMTVGGRYSVTCHHADNPASFWLQRNDEIPAIEELQEKLQIAAASCPTLEEIPEERTLCLAMYSVDDMWYRAEIIDADAEITTIRFIDFGNTDVVYTGQGKSKRITDSLKSVKRYATKCRLDVIPHGSEDWTSSVNEWFVEAVGSTENMEALVIADSSPRRVELFVNGKSLVDELVERNYATRINTEEDLLEEIFEREVDPRAAYVSHAISPNEFWIQQEKYVGDLEVLADRFIVAHMFPRVGEIKEGLLCVAQFPEDEDWYRARVVSHADSGTEVIYIDYGNSAISKEIREIPEDLAGQPAFSKKCRLAMPEGIEQWSEEACTEFVKMAADGATIFQLDVLEEAEDISLVRLTQNGKDIVESLAKLCSALIPVIEERLPPLGEENSPNVLVSHVNSPSDFFTQAESSINELEAIVEHLAPAESFLPLDNIEEGTICAAKFPEDEQWYRAKILSHGDSGTEVLYIDYGNSAITTELRVLPEDIARIPALSMSCSLLMPERVESWSKEACEKFFELVDEGVTMFQYEILEEKDERSIVRLSCAGKDVAETLLALCAMKENEEPAGHDEAEKEENRKSMIVDDVTETRSFVTCKEFAETCISHRDTFSEEHTSSNETSGVEISTTTDTSSLSTCSKSETSMECPVMPVHEIGYGAKTNQGMEKVSVEIAKIAPAGYERVSQIFDAVEIGRKIVKTEQDPEEVPVVETVAEEAMRVEKVSENVPSVEKAPEEVSGDDNADEGVFNVENVPAETLIVENLSEIVASAEEAYEKVDNIRAHDSDEKINSEDKDVAVKAQKFQSVEEEMTRPKILMVEKILPDNISHGSSSTSATVKLIARRNSISNEDKIVPGSINRGEDLRIDDSTGDQSTDEVSRKTTVESRLSDDSACVVARKLSFSDKSDAEIIAKNDSTSRENECPTTPKTPHSEKIVAGVVNLQENIDEFEKDEILEVVTDEKSIPK